MSPSSDRWQPALRSAAEREAFETATLYQKTAKSGLSGNQTLFDTLPWARRSILHIVLASLYRERPQILDPPVVVHTDAWNEGDEFLECIPHLDPDGIYPLVEDHEWIVGFPLSESASMIMSGGTHMHAFDRYLPEGPAIAWSANDSKRLTHPTDVLQMLRTEGVFPDKSAFDTLRQELEESVANLALAGLAGDRLKLESDAENAEHPLDALAPNGPDLNSSLERLAAVEERPTNPSTKIRKGASSTAGVNYSPEFTGRIDLHFVAIDREHVLEHESSGGQTLTSYLLSSFQGLEAATERIIPNRKKIDEYAILPIHPWQRYHTLEPEYQHEIRQETVIPIPDYTKAASPLMNFRTVVPWPADDDNGHHWHLKLPVNIQKTSIVRVLEAQMIHNTPRMTDLLQEIFRDAAYPAQGILETRAAACYFPTTADDRPEREDRAKQLSTLARINPYHHPLVQDSSVPVTTACLPVIPPGCDYPLIYTCIEYMASRSQMSIEESAFYFLDRYVALTLPFQIHLNCKYGIKLSTHLQNMILILDPDFVPSAVLVRDLGDSRVYQPRLKAHGYSIDPYPDSDIHVTDLSEHIPRTISDYFQLNLGEIIGALVRQVSIEETECWKLVAQHVTETFAKLEGDGDVPGSWIEHDKEEIFAKTVRKPPRLRKFIGEKDLRRTRTAPNPLVGHLPDDIPRQTSHRPTSRELQ